MQALTKKVGPLPLWAYAVILGGAFLAVRLLRRGQSGQDASVQLIPTGAPPIDPSAGFLNELSMRLDRIETRVTDPPPASSDSSDGTLNIVRAIQEAVQTQIIERIQGAIQPLPPTPQPQPLPAPAPTPPPVTAPAPAPISAKPTRISVAEAQAVLRSMGLRESLATSGAWIQSSAADYVWRTADTFRAWALRATRK